MEANNISRGMFMYMHEVLVGIASHLHLYGEMKTSDIDRVLADAVDQLSDDDRVRLNASAARSTASAVAQRIAFIVK